jgi:hypothetical protein
VGTHCDKLRYEALQIFPGNCVLVVAKQMECQDHDSPMIFSQGHVWGVSTRTAGTVRRFGTTYVQYKGVCPAVPAFCIASLRHCR